MPALLNAKTVLNSFVPISRFNKGEASKIINEVQTSGIKFIVRNNTPECVMLSLKAYEDLLEELEDMELSAIALEREAAGKNRKTIPLKKVMDEEGITQADLDGIADSEVELG